MDGSEHLRSRADEVVFFVSFVAIVLLTWLLVSEDWFSSVFNSSSRSQAAVIGEIKTYQRDLRLRRDGSYLWIKKISDRQMRLGDSLFVGEGSEAIVFLSSQSEMKIRENSLIKFVRINGIDMPNLRAGTLLASVKGKFSFLVNGEAVTVLADDADVEIVSSEAGSHVVKLRRGTGTILWPGREEQALNHEPRSFNEKVAAKSEPLVASVLSRKPPTYWYKLYDIFDLNFDGTLARRVARRSTTDLYLDVSWKLNRPGPLALEVSSDLTFSSSVSQTRALAEDLRASVKGLVVGMNYWRIRSEDGSWASLNPIEVKASFLSDGKAKILNHHRVPIAGGGTEVTGKIQCGTQFSLIEISSSPNFDSGKSVALWQNQSDFRFNYSESGPLYGRVWCLDKEYQLFGPSQVAKLPVDLDQLLPPPQFKVTNYQIYENEELDLVWESSPGAMEYEVWQSSHFEKRARIKENEFLFRARLPGTYKIDIAAIGKNQNRSRTTTLVVTVVPQPRSIAQVQEPPRNQSFLDGQQQKLNVSSGSQVMSSKVLIESAAYSMYSRSQLSASDPNPVAWMIGLRWTHWYGRDGFEASAFSKVLDLSSTSESGASLLQTEIRYRRRWFSRFNPFSPGKDSELSALAGVEVYRNFGAVRFSKGYELLKAGVALVFPFLKRWDTGGEIILGGNEKLDRKYEVSGNFHYYLERQLSIGVGYRVHLFESGSSGSSPMGLPYREGFGEGYSVLRWHY